MQTVLAHLGKLTILLMAVASGLSWWLAPAPPPPPVSARQSEPWTLPAVSRSKPDESAAAIAGANLWGAVQATAEVPLNDPEWHFSGVTAAGKEKFVMITVEGQPMQTLKAGDQLPGGAKILQINDDHLCLSIKGRKRKLDLFQ